MGPARELDASAITEAVRELCIQINYVVPEDMVAAVKRAREAEESPVAKQILELLVKNQELAAEGEYPYCQDTGYTVVFIDLGQDVHITGADLPAPSPRGWPGRSRVYCSPPSVRREPLFDRTNT